MELLLISNLSQRYALPLLIAAFASALSCRATIQREVRRRAHNDPEVLYYVDTQAKAAALTIDDGPDAVTTGKILDVLKQNDAHATFFIITGRVPGNEALLKRMVDENHELGNHLTRNEASIRLSPEEFERQLVQSHAVLARFGRVQWFRPGHGRYNKVMLATLKRHNYRCALGSVYPFDPVIRWSWFSRRFILSNTRPGSIIVLHDSGGMGKRTIKTLSKVLPALKKRGLRIVTLSELVDLGQASKGEHDSEK
jgi:peptidoglycan/xylan/chitin deacetylase (PgdA/CDA1 family)